MNLIKIFFASFLLCCVTYTQAQDKTSHLLSELKEIKDNAILNRKLAELGKGTEDDMTVVLRYFNIQRNYSKSDSISALIINRFPRGPLAYESFLSKFLVEKSLVGRKKMYEEGLTNFSGLNLDRLHSGMSEAFLGNRDLKMALILAEKIEDPWQIAGIAGQIQDMGSSTAEELLRLKIDTLQKLGKKESLSPLLYQLSVVLNKRGDYEQALKYAEESYATAEWKSDAMTANYTGLLLRFGKYPDVIRLLEPIVKNGKANPAAKIELETAYKLANSGKDAQAYMNQLKQVHLIKLREELAGKMTNVPASEFLGHDINDKKISLSQFKGKVLVIDFWATWCVPCKASFPAMQMAVKKYANDPNVAFLFVHTYEKTPQPLKDASTYLKEKGFDFNLIMDYRDQITKKSLVASSFGVNSLPTKLVIDGAGKVRFSVSGYFGNDEALIDELSTMIEMAKEQR